MSRPAIQAQRGEPFRTRHEELEHATIQLRPRIGWQRIGRDRLDGKTQVDQPTRVLDAGPREAQAHRATGVWLQENRCGLGGEREGVGHVGRLAEELKDRAVEQGVVQGETQAVRDRVQATPTADGTPASSVKAVTWSTSLRNGTLPSRRQQLHSGDEQASPLLEVARERGLLWSREGVGTQRVVIESPQHGGVGAQILRLRRTTFADGPKVVTDSDGVQRICGFRERQIDCARTELVGRIGIDE